MAKEIERKFLVKSDDWRADATSSTEFRQGYIASMDDRSVRIRLLDGKQAKLTIKIGKGILSRDEFEYDIPVADGEELIESAIGIVLQKTRHLVSYRGYTWEIDVYDGAYRGLVVAEVEMKGEAETPALPEWLGLEVTGDRRFSNQVMATEDVSAELCNAV